MVQGELKGEQGVEGEVAWQEERERWRGKVQVISKGETQVGEQPPLHRNHLIMVGTKAGHQIVGSESV